MTSLAGARTVEELPEKARIYLKKLEQVTGCPVALVSIGPRRDQTIQVRNPFA
jgi:adenylosuccinate synthase